jgi:hypothetical protein
MMDILKKLANPASSDSLANRTRQKNFNIFKDLFSRLSKPLKILDIGGTQEYWEKMNFSREEDVEITLLNIYNSEVNYPNFKSIAGDARDLTAFKDKEFDIVFSHSVIEHVGGLKDQHRMAEEIKRVGKRYFIQTPNLYFPMEPHFLFPMFQFFPLWLKIWLISHYDLGWYVKTPEKEKALEIVKSIRLLCKKELYELFPGAIIYREKFLGLTKSFIVYDGWNNI